MRAAQSSKLGATIRNRTMAGTAASSVSHIRCCDDCGNDMPMARTHCPHCGRPQYFPNVDLAKTSGEKAKLQARYEATMTDAERCGCKDNVNKFTAACAGAAAVFACGLQRLHREVASGTDIYETYNHLQRLRLRTSPPETLDWARLRPQAEIELLGSHEHLDKIHYACLSIDGVGLNSYGDCTVRLSEPMIAHRASCFEGNTAVLYHTERSFSVLLRCEWNDRGLICTATFGDHIDCSTGENDYPGILLKVGAASEQDQFIEVHVFGPMTARTFESVRIDTTSHSRRHTALLNAIREKLAAVDVEVMTAP